MPYLHEDLQGAEAVLPELRPPNLDARLCFDRRVEQLQGSPEEELPVEQQGECVQHSQAGTRLRQRKGDERRRWRQEWLGPGTHPSRGPKRVHTASRGGSENQIPRSHGRGLFTEHPGWG